MAVFTFPLDLAGAAVELAEKPMSQIQRETALKWAARAVVAYKRFAEGESVQWLLDAEDYAHEALEHVVFAENEKLENELKMLLTAARKKALSLHPS